MRTVSILSSPRRRRRLLKAAVVIVPLIPLIYLGVHYSSPGSPGEATGPNIREPGYAQPKAAPFTKKEQRAVRRVLRDFEATAVVRRDVGRSWDLAAPSLKESFTRKQWRRGQLPVVPYPAASRGLGSLGYVQYSYRNAVGLEVLLFPKPGSGWSAMTADVELVKGRDGRWRVSYWMPKKFHGPPAVAVKRKAKAPKHTVQAKAAGKRHAPTRTAAPAATGPPRQSRLWWIVPIALLALIVVAPLAMAMRMWLKNRREYARGMSR